ncbi:hypothetical protein BDV19DRAFT_378804 [Aspergillus venezuelensis]
MASPIESLPTELLDEIIDCLSFSPPPSNRLHQPPTDQLTRSRTRDLKNLSLSCPRLLELVRPSLFSHGCFETQDIEAYLSFISKSELSRYITSLVVKGCIGLNNKESSGPPWWRRLLSSITPRRLTVVAPPTAIGEIFGMQVPQEHAWAFEISFQVVQLECDWQKCKPALASNEQSSLLDCLPWSSMLFNESSSLKAYNHYEYFLYQVPSIIHRWGPWTPNETDHLSSSLSNLTSFTYVAVFPFYNHVQQVLEAVDIMTNLRTLKIQLGPTQNNRVTELEQRGSMDPSDPWMELATGYSLIAHAVRGLGRKGSLSKFIACDYEMEAVRAEIDVILGDILCDGPWSHDGKGTWNKKPVIDGVDAEPALASSLLQQTSRVTEKTILSGSSTESWNLATDIEKSLFPPLKDDLFHPGKVIGFSKLRGRLNEAGDDEVVGQVRFYLFQLQARLCQPSPATPAYIIHPQTSNIFSPQSLLTSLLSHQTNSTTTSDARNNAISLLDSVTLFPVYDFASAIDAIHDMSGRLSQEQEQLGDQDQQDQQHPAETVLYLVGLDALTDSVIRSSSALRGAAVLSSVLRTVTGLSRVYKESLSVLLVNTSGVGPALYQTNQAQQQRGNDTTTTTSAGSGNVAGIHSAFSTPDTNLFPSLLMKTLDQGIDTHLLFSRGRGKNVVEVIKDRVGDGLGRWCVWPPKVEDGGVSR